VGSCSANGGRANARHLGALQADLPAIRRDAKQLDALRIDMPETARDHQLSRVMLAAGVRCVVFDSIALAGDFA